jgi:hypothetical protein
MPAASCAKKARQRANKVLQKEENNLELPATTTIVQPLPIDDILKAEQIRQESYDNGFDDAIVTSEFKLEKQKTELSAKFEKEIEDIFDGYKAMRARDAQQKSTQTDPEPCISPANASTLTDPETIPSVSASIQMHPTLAYNSSGTQTSRDDVHTPETRLSFFNFITIATTDNIKIFLEFAATTPEGENLEHLWERAYNDGYEKGRNSLLQDLEKKMENEYEEGVEKGKCLGREEGFIVARDGFLKAIAAKEAKEASDKAITSNSGTQTDLTPPYLTSGTQTTSVDTILRATTDVFVQTNPVSAQDRENAKTDDTSKILPNTAVFRAIFESEQPTESPVPASIVSALKNQSIIAGLVQKHQKTEKPPSLNEIATDLRATTTHGIPFRPATHRDQETTRTVDPHQLPTARSQAPAISVHEKSTLSHVVFESNLSTESLVPTPIVTALETRQEMAGFSEKHEKVDNSHFFTQNTPETPVPSFYDATVSISPIGTDVRAQIVCIEPELPVSSARQENGKTGFLVNARAQMKKDGERKEGGECRKSGTEVEAARNDDEKPKPPFSPPYQPSQTHFNWAEDAESIPITHNYKMQLWVSTIPTKYNQNFGQPDNEIKVWNMDMGIYDPLMFIYNSTTKMTSCYLKLDQCDILSVFINYNLRICENYNSAYIDDWRSPVVYVSKSHGDVIDARVFRGDRRAPYSHFIILRINIYLKFNVGIVETPEPDKPSVPPNLQTVTYQSLNTYGQQIII